MNASDSSVQAKSIVIQDQSITPDNSSNQVKNSQEQNGAMNNKLTLDQANLRDKPPLEVETNEKLAQSKHRKRKVISRFIITLFKRRKVKPFEDGQDPQIKKPKAMKNKSKSTNSKKKENGLLNEEDDEVKICFLCRRERPVFALNSDDQMATLPDRMLTPFVKGLRQDFRQKYEYLKYLHITTKFIKPCECEDFHVHQYCMTIRIVKNQKIYCDSCKQYYLVYLKKEKVCTHKFTKELLKYLCLFFLILLCAGFFLALDYFLKIKESKTTSNTPFSFREIFWLVLVPIFVLLLIMFLWCFYFKFLKNFIQNKKVQQVEVLQHSTHPALSRQQSKQNLNTVIEVSTGFQLQSFMFDKFWFNARQQRIKEVKFDVTNKEDATSYKNDLVNQVSQELKKQANSKKMSSIQIQKITRTNSIKKSYGAIFQPHYLFRQEQLTHLHTRRGDLHSSFINEHGILGGMKFQIERANDQLPPSSMRIADQEIKTFTKLFASQLSPRSIRSGKGSVQGRDEIGDQRKYSIYSFSGGYQVQNHSSFPSKLCIQQEGKLSPKLSSELLLPYAQNSSSPSIILIQLNLERQKSVNLEEMIPINISKRFTDPLEKIHEMESTVNSPSPKQQIKQVKAQISQFPSIITENEEDRTESKEQQSSSHKSKFKDEPSSRTRQSFKQYRYPFGNENSEQNIENQESEPLRTMQSEIDQKDPDSIKLPSIHKALSLKSKAVVKSSFSELV